MCNNAIRVNQMSGMMKFRKTAAKNVHSITIMSLRSIKYDCNDAKKTLTGSKYKLILLCVENGSSSISACLIGTMYVKLYGNHYGGVSEHHSGNIEGAQPYEVEVVGSRIPLVNFPHSPIAIWFHFHSYNY